MPSERDEGVKKQSGSTRDLVLIGTVRRAHGVRGELLVTPHTDDPARFGLLRELYVAVADEGHRRVGVVGARVSNKGVLLRLSEVTDRDTAEALVGAELLIPREQCLPLPPDSYYEFELWGMEVRTTAGRVLGTLHEVVDFPANDVWVVRDQEHEYLLPAVKEVIKMVDREERVIIIEPIPGLVDEEP
ncbi:MAG: ribosome maturation factor RimM [candidate division KSB1 bacterium]|nr:ribosome maturation factor RimM [candidate division KSB1 bacterium]MDZ7295553.1 ribosome maturation factor RimM [candidate division KSB1 bacterium]MDZ7386803.1 ribosome maturation factor RimM [candidate division KSB1 bacterium]MDZ7392547.1 ribosome maturation factor RimM [candidate division KSB1 bacterium]